MSEREVEHFALSACESASVSANTFVMCAFFFSLRVRMGEGVCWMCSFDLKHSG